MGDLWTDLFTNTVNRCTSISPVTFVEVGGGGGGSGTVTQVNTGTGLTGGPITTSGTIGFANIANNTVLGNVSGSADIPIAINSTDISTLLGLGTLATQNGTFSGTSSGTNTGDQTITLTGDVTGSGVGSFAATLATVNSNVGSFTNSNITVNAKGLITAASSGTAPVLTVSGTSGRITSSGTTAITLDLDTTAVTPASYTNTSLTVDAYGRLTAASSGTAPVTSVSGTAANVSSTGGTTPVINLVDTAVTPGSYTYTALTVDAKGRITTASSGAAPTGTVTAVTGTANRITSTGGTTPAIDISASYVGQASIVTLGTVTTGTWNGTIVAGTYGGTGVNNGSKTITLGGDLVTSGAFNTTFTVTGNTNVTFPTSGTLSTTTGTVTSVSGTSNRITSTGGATPVIDISGSYVGQSSITTLGTIATGVWNGTVVTGTYGGTGVNNGASTITLGGNLTTSGAFTTTLIVTGNTSVTLPTSGTLSTTTGTVTSVATGAGLTGGTITSTGTISIPNSGVTLAMQANIADQTILGNNTGGAAAPVALTASQGRTVLGLGTLATQSGTFSGTSSGTNTGDQTITLTGDITGSGTGSFATTLATVNSNVGSFTNSSITVNAKGLITAASSGTAPVTSVTGTTNRITSSGGTTPAIDISASYVGQSSITTLGTITTGVWNGTTIVVANGGTGITTTTAYGVLTGGTTATGAFQNTGTGTLGWSLVGQGTSALPIFTPIPNKNIAYNGDFQIWTRGAEGSASVVNTTQYPSGIYTADRWKTVLLTSTTMTIAQTAGALTGQFYGKVQQPNGTVSNGGLMGIFQSIPIDACVGVAGNKITLSYKVKAGANYSASGSTVSVQVYSGTGTTDVGIFGGFTGSHIEIDTANAITTTLTNVSNTSGTLGSTVTQLQFAIFYVPAGTSGADDSFYITDVKLEIGPSQTAFLRLGKEESRLQCLPFCQKSFIATTAPAQNAGAGSGEFVFPATIAAATANICSSIMYSARMRATPTITLYSPAAATAQAYNETRTAACTATSVSSSSDKSFYIVTTGPVTTVVGDKIGLHYLLEAEL